MGTVAIDAVDREILGELARDGRVSWQDLARRVRLSPTATAERVRRLERSGVITGYRAVVDPIALGRLLECFVDEITDAVHLTGRADYALTVQCAGTADLDRLLLAMKADAGVAETDTRVVLGGPNATADGRAH